MAITLKNDVGSVGNRPKFISGIAAASALLGGLVSILGWMTGLYRLTDWWSTGIAIKVNTAVAIMAAATALLITVFYSSRLARQLSRWLAFFTLAVGGLTLLEHLSGYSFGIDTLLFDEPAGAPATAAPGRMGPPASFSFLALGTAIFLRAGSDRFHTASVALALAVIAIGTLSLVGYWYGAEAMYTIPRLTGISIQTAIMLVALGSGVIASHAQREPMKTLCEDSGTGLLARRLLAASFIVPIVLGWLRIQGFQSGLYDNSFGTALRSLVEIVILIGVSWWSVQAIRARELRQRRAEEELREANRQKDNFLATLSHELRNPLAPIRNAAALLLKKNVSVSTLQLSAAIIDRQVRHMARLLEDLLDISRLSRNLLVLRKEPISLSQVLQAALETSRPSIEKAEHKLSVQLPSEAIVVEGDAVRLAQVFSNLLNNAAQYTERGGHIQVSAECEDAAVIIHVIDNGIGIDSQSIAHIFEMFTQAAPSSGTKSGLGIGLWLAREIIELHGGSIEALSAGARTGSRFSVRLPRLPDRSATMATADNAPNSPSQLRLLVVDDSQDSADTLGILLRYLDHHVEIAYDGVAALNSAETFRPHAIFMDVGMPKLDGLEVCRRLRLTPWGQTIFVVALTGWGDTDDVRRTAAAGFNAHLTKPADLDEIMQLLSKIATRTLAGEHSAESESHEIDG